MTSFWEPLHHSTKRLLVTGCARERAAIVLAAGAMAIGCRSPATATRVATDVDRRLCSPAPPPGPPEFVGSVGTRGDRLSVGFPQPGLEATLSNIRQVSTMGMSSGGTVTYEEADTSEARPHPCVFTVVYADAACRVEATGTRRAGRQLIEQLHSPDAGPPGGWTLLLDVVDSDGCIAKRTGNGTADKAVTVAGWRPDLRVVDFELIVSRTGGDGSTGVLADAAGKDLRAEVATWPKEEVAHTHDVGFEAWRTKSGDLYWFTSLSDANSPWTSRLRDRSGRLLPLPHIGDGTFDSAGRVVVLREGSHLFWRHGQIQ